MKSMRNNSWPLSKESRQFPDAGIIVVGGNTLRTFAVLLVSISGLTLLIWQSRSVSLENEPPEPSIPTQFELLDSAQVPTADLADLAERLGGRERVDTAFPGPVQSTFDPGSIQRFWVTDMHGNRFQVETKLWLETAQNRMWVQVDLEMDFHQLVQLGRSLEEHIYPAVNLMLGKEPASHDVTVEIVFTDKLGPKVAGYFSPLDRISSKIFETSNGRMMILINAKLAQDQDRLARLVAHELQHLIHWELDSNESVWVQEGYSGFAEQLVGQTHNPRHSAYLAAPDLQLNSWPLDGDFARHYGAASLLINYFDHRLGSTFVRALAHHPADGLKAVDAVMFELELFDAARDRFLTADDLILDWGLANYLQRSFGPYAYMHSMEVPRASATENLGNCAELVLDHSVSQYGFDYFRFQCDDPVVLEFLGAPSTKLVPTTAHSGEYFFWSNRGDLVDTRLTREFDFTDAHGPLTLQFWTWYELEKGSDFVYLLASEDRNNWSFLETTSGNAVNEVAGTQMGFGYSGINRRYEWSRQTVDLSEFAGKRVTLRFEYVTDMSQTGEGFLIDDLSVLETDYRADFEDGPNGWESEGFVRVSNTIPQQFLVSLLRGGSPVAAEHLTLDASNGAIVNLDAGEEIVLVVMGASRHTRQPASYSLSLTH